MLLVLALTLELGLLSGAWPHPGLGSLPKLYLCDVALYLYLVVRNVEGVGYCFMPNASAFAIGAREWLYFLPFAFGLGFALHFISFHPRGHSAAQIAAAVLVTFLLTAVPEELFFRGMLQNLLERQIGRRRALGRRQCAVRPVAFPQRRGLQLALCCAGRRCRSILRTRLASPAAIAGFQHYAHGGGCGVVAVVPVGECCWKEQRFFPIMRCGFTCAGIGTTFVKATLDGMLRSMQGPCALTHDHETRRGKRFQQPNGCEVGPSHLLRGEASVGDHGTRCLRGQSRVAQLCGEFLVIVSGHVDGKCGM